ncbi:MAG: ATP-binding cassette domain-containing protein [Spirochaetes bacterium]|nr:ATP-binding cassette domain-containing protein [Spirochaetota bacterium]MBU0954692.1 ATP-binding cassette domain-containing protein [Spirochaetota bacterium]
MQENNTRQSEEYNSATAVLCSALNVDFHGIRVLSNIHIAFRRNAITSLIGEEGSGKTTLLRAINRSNEEFAASDTSGTVYFNGSNLYAPATDLAALRRKIAYIFPEPRPFPVSVYANISWAARFHKMSSDLDRLVEESLKEGGLWDELKDKLRRPASTLSPGQQQRLCIARALALKPEIILMDEPASSLDALSAGRVESLIRQLKTSYTVIVANRSVQRASRISDYCAFLQDGSTVEFGDTGDLFLNPKDPRTEQFLSRSMH